MKTGLMIAFTVASLGFGGAALAAGDAAAGKAKFEAVCADCHEPQDQAAMKPAEFDAAIRGIVAGTVKHKKKLTLTDAEIANLGAYFATVK